MPHQVGIFVFKNDLRLHDNPALAKAAAEVDELICIYCLEAKQPVSSLRAQATCRLIDCIFYTNLSAAYIPAF